MSQVTSAELQVTSNAPSSPGDQGQNTQTLIILLNTPQKNASEPRLKVKEKVSRDPAQTVTTTVRW